MSTASGLRPISTIAVGELVLAWDATTRSTGYYTVTAVMLHTDAAQVHLSVGGEHVETTPEHPFYTLERGWVAAGDLWDGAHVRRADGSYALTLVLWLDAEPQVMYNLTVATAHTFFVGVERALVHNAGCWKWKTNKFGGQIDDYCGRTCATLLKSGRFPEGAKIVNPFDTYKYLAPRGVRTGHSAIYWFDPDLQKWVWTDPTIVFQFIEYRTSSELVPNAATFNNPILRSLIEIKNFDTFEEEYYITILREMAEYIGPPPGRIK